MECAWEGEKARSIAASLDWVEGVSTLSLAFGEPVGTGVAPSEEGAAHDP